MERAQGDEEVYGTVNDEAYESISVDAFEQWDDNPNTLDSLALDDTC